MRVSGGGISFSQCSLLKVPQREYCVDMSEPLTRIDSVSPTWAGGTGAIRSVDRDLLLCLRSGKPKTIDDLTEVLGVTATAVRQRVERLLETGLIDRQKIVAGRGRPTFRYRLTEAGYGRAGADAAEFADAMWQQILALPDDNIREGLITAIAKRMGQQYAVAIARDESTEDNHFGSRENSRPGSEPAASESDAVQSDADEQFSQRMKRLSQMLQRREIPAFVSVSARVDLPVLEVEACPYPNLTDTSDDRAMCRLEEKMLSEALGKEVHLRSCRLDGDSCCQFSAAEI